MLHFEVFVFFYVFVLSWLVGVCLIRFVCFVYSVMMWRRESFLKEFIDKGHALFCGNFGTYPVSKSSGIIIKNSDDLKLADLLMRSISSESDQYLIEYDDLVNNFKDINL